MICGVWNLDGAPVERQLLLDMIDCMTSSAVERATAIHLEGAIAMAVVAIRPRPLVVPTPTLVVETDGCLAADARCYVGRPGMDSPGLVAESIRLDKLAACHGDWAFAHWSKSRSQLTLGRDHFGVRPLQYTVRPGRYVAFASLPSALLQTGLAERKLDAPVIASFPVNRQPCPGRTYFESIASVRAAHTVTFDADQNRVERRYWRIAVDSRMPLDTDFEASAREVRRLLEQAVARRLPEEGSVGSHCSGGLDSTPIAVIAAQTLAGQNRACLGFSFHESRDGLDFDFVDESPYVNAAAAQQGNLQLRPIHSPGFFATMSDGVDPDTMLPLSPLEPEEVVLRQSAAAGVEIILSGWGGDQAVTGFGAELEAELFKSFRWAELGRELNIRSRASGRSASREFLSRVLLRLLPRPIFDWIGRARGFSPWLDRASFAAPAVRPLQFAEANRLHGDSHRARRDYLEAWWIPNRLELFAQQGARHGIAYAYPMLDLDLLDYVMRLPVTVFRRGGVPRALIREAIKGLVPENVRGRIEKLAPYPLEAVRVAARRAEIIAAFEEMRNDPLVDKFIDVDAVTAYLRSGRDELSLKQALQESFDSGAPFYSNEEDYENALLVSKFLVAQSQLAARG